MTKANSDPQPPTPDPQLDVDLYVMATDEDGVYLDWGTPEARKIDRITNEELESFNLAADSMGPKVAAACAFTRVTCNRAAIGALAEIEAIVAGEPAPLSRKRRGKAIGDNLVSRGTDISRLPRPEKGEKHV